MRPFGRCPHVLPAIGAIGCRERIELGHRQRLDKRGVVGIAIAFAREQVGSDRAARVAIGVQPDDQEQAAAGPDLLFGQ